MSRDFPREASHVSVKYICTITVVQDTAAILGMGDFVENSFVKEIKCDPGTRC